MAIDDNEKAYIESNQLGAKIAECKRLGQVVLQLKVEVEDHKTEATELKAENERLRNLPSFYNGKSAEGWYTLYCQEKLEAAKAVKK